VILWSRDITLFGPEESPQGVTFEVGSESESVSPRTERRAIQQGVTPVRAQFVRRFKPELHDRTLFKPREILERKMDYNQLKIQVLALFKGAEELASEDVRKALLESSKIELSDKAVKMALMRYTRQGLLSRSKKEGTYHYSLTEKGSSRRDWLAKTMLSSADAGAHRSGSTGHRPQRGRSFRAQL
jgi:predicted transcriptional regulator